MSDRNDRKVSRRLRRKLKDAGLPQVGSAHVLRMRFVQVMHALLILQNQCNHDHIVRAMEELLTGWSAAEEEHSEVGGYQHRLLNAIDDIHSQIEDAAWGEWDAIMSERTYPVTTLPQLAAEDEAVVRELANQLHGLAIASRSECLNIAMDLLNAGCSSLHSLLECPSITTIQELQTELGTLKNVQLTHLQLRTLVNWIQQQRQA